jgi:CRISPR associated protein cas1
VHDVEGEIVTTDNLLLDEEKVVECFTLPALRCAWERVLKKDAQDGDISDSVERFAEGVQERLEELAEELRVGTFRPSDLTRVVIPKKNGERFLDIPSVRDRIVERAILEHINPAIDPLFGATAFGYRPGLGVADAAQEVVRLREEGYTHVLRTDVHDCFPSLPVALLRRQLEFLIAEPEILAVVDLLLDRCTRFPGKGRGVFPGLPQGSPLSPLLANLALIPLDEALVDAGFPVVRYADDLVIALEEPGDAPEALRTATKVLKELGMELGAEKTAVASFFEGFAFLGEDFGPRYPPAEGEGRIREPDKKILYVAKQGSRIQVRKGRVQVIQDDHELLSVPVSDISRMVCFGSVGVTAGARSWALQNGVDVLLASRGCGFHRAIETTP